MHSFCIFMDCIGVLTKSQIPPIPGVVLHPPRDPALADTTPETAWSRANTPQMSSAPPPPPPPRGPRAPPSPPTSAPMARSRPRHQPVRAEVLNEASILSRGCQDKYPISGATVIANKTTTSDIILPEQHGILTLWRPRHPIGGRFFFNGQSWTNIL